MENGVLLWVFEVYPKEYPVLLSWKNADSDPDPVPLIPFVFQADPAVIICHSTIVAFFILTFA